MLQRVDRRFGRLREHVEVKNLGGSRRGSREWRPHARSTARNARSSSLQARRADHFAPTLNAPEVHYSRTVCRASGPNRRAAVVLADDDADEIEDEMDDSGEQVLRRACAVADVQDHASVRPPHPEAVRVATGSAWRQGPKDYMEDRLCVCDSLWCHIEPEASSSLFPGCSFSGVFDGHHGTLAADMASKHLHLAVYARGPLRKFRRAQTPPASNGAAAGRLGRRPAQWWLGESANNKTQEDQAFRNTKIALERAFAEVDELILGVARRQPRNADGAISLSGTTALVAVRLEEELYLANAGDCRAVLSRRGLAKRLTMDHKLEASRERRRVMEEGGWINTDRHGVQRVTIPARDPLTKPHGVSTTRGLGDLHFKFPHPLLTSTPEVTMEELRAGDQFLVLGTDGVWASLEDQDVVDVARDACVAAAGATRKQVADRMAAAVVDAALAAGSTDNASAIVMLLDSR